MPSDDPGVEDLKGARPAPRAAFVDLTASPDEDREYVVRASFIDLTETPDDDEDPEEDFVVIGRGALAGDHLALGWVEARDVTRVLARSGPFKRLGVSVDNPMVVEVEPRLRGTKRLAQRSGEDLMRGGRRRGFRSSNPQRLEQARDRVLARRAWLRHRHADDRESDPNGERGSL